MAIRTKPSAIISSLTRLESSTELISLSQISSQVPKIIEEKSAQKVGRRKQVFQSINNDSSFHFDGEDSNLEMKSSHFPSSETMDEKE